MSIERITGESGSLWTYDTETLLGSPGGFGAVFAGRSSEDRDVAVKRVTFGPEAGLSEGYAQREVKIISKLGSVPGEHILRFFDVATDGTHIFIVMERAEYSLAHRLRNQIEEAEGLEILKSISTGLLELHQAGVIHRDLKPGNVLFVDGTWKLADFGIARDVDVSTSTFTWRGAGTYPFMAPELWQPPGRANVKTDLYALGCLAFQVITGALPFNGPDEASFMKQHLGEAPPPIAGTLNLALRRVVLRLLSKAAVDRPQDARAVCDMLNRIVLGTPPPQMAELLREVERHSNERAEAAASEARAAERARVAYERGQQAKADLKAILEEAHADMEQWLPDLRLEFTDWHMVLRSDDAFLSFDLWGNINPSDLRYAVHVPEIVSAAVIKGANRSNTGGSLGNIACLVQDGRLIWYLYRFKKNFLMQRYFVNSPHDRSHGFERSEFFDEDVFPRIFQTGMHIFTVGSSELTPSSIPGLYRAALALPRDA